MNSIYRLAGISKQAYHKQSISGTIDIGQLKALQKRVEDERKDHGGVGLEKLHARLQPGWIGRDRFVRVFQQLGYGVKKRRKHVRTTNSGLFRFPNLIEGLLLWDKNRLWQTDITFYRIGERFYFLTFIIDVYTKVIRGYQVSDTMRAEANIKALQMALDSQLILPGLIHHSDGGSQFIDRRYQKLASDHGLIFSMGKKAQENAYAERVNGIIKNEYLQYKSIASFRQLIGQVSKAVNHYNTKRIHRHLPDRLTPVQFENELLALDTQNRPKVIVYTEGNPKIRAASSHPDFNPETEPQVHVCPMENNRV